MEESQNDYTSDSLDAKAMMVKKLEVFVTRTLVRNCNKPNPQRVKHNQLETVCENFKFYIFTTTDSQTKSREGKVTKCRNRIEPFFFVTSLSPDLLQPSS